MDLLRTFLATFIPLFVAIDALAVVPAFVTLTEGETPQERSRTLRDSVLTGLLFGLAPAVRTTRVDMSPALKSTGTTMIRHTRGRWSPRQVLVSVQVGLCVLLVSGAGLLGQTLRNLETRPTGIDRHNLLGEHQTPCIEPHLGIERRQVAERGAE